MIEGASALVLAGGRGERFWPWSRADLPKQLLPLADGGRTLLDATLDRVERFVPPERTWVLTGADLRAAVERVVGARGRVLTEPVGRNTAPAAGLLAHHAIAHGAEGPMMVLPADHLIPDVTVFQRTAEAALALAARESLLVTLGVAPARPETGYGYIERGAALPSPAGAFRVLRFREKPDLETARGFLAAGTFYWNSGIFFWRPRVFLDTLAHTHPALSAGLVELAALRRGAKSETDDRKLLDERFPALESISVDYAVLERADNVAMIEVAFEWDDLGSWEKWAARQSRDAAGNVLEGNAVAIDSENCVILAGEEPVAVIGGRGLVVVHKPSGTLVCPIERSEEVRRAVIALKERSRA
jgi:mannose-1-phosphate guanylyltransferase